MKTKFLFRSYLGFMMTFLLLTSILDAQTTYTWNTAGGSWINATNWTPTRTTPAADDRLVINVGGNIAITDVPTETIGRLTISNNTNVSFSGNAGVQILTIGNGSGDDLIVNSGSFLTILTGLENLTLTAGASADISGTFQSNSIYNIAAAGTLTTVSGTFISATTSGTITGSTAANFVVTATGTYEHNLNGGTVPTATWTAGSHLNITGMGGTYPLGMNQTFHHVSFNGGTGTTVMSSDLTVNGDFTLNRTGGTFRATNSTTNINLSIGGNLYFSGAGNLEWSGAAGSTTVTIGGDFIKTSSGNYTGTSGSGANTTSVAGDLDIQFGSFRIANAGGASTMTVGGNATVQSNVTLVGGNGNGTLSVSGNYNHISGTLVVTDGGGNGTLNVLGDYTLQSGSFIVGSGGGTGIANIGGDFFHQTGDVMVDSDSAGDSYLNITGDYIKTSGTLLINNSNGIVEMNVGGDFINISGNINHRPSSGGSDPATITVGGDFILSAGIYNMTNTTGAGTLNVAGDFTIGAAATITETHGGAGVGIINFNGDGTPQIFTNGGTILNIINFTVISGAFLQMADGTTQVTGDGTFTLEDDATLGIRSPGGISLTGATGNIRVTGTRTYSTGANYIYNGTTSQITGTGLPATVRNLTIDNSGGAVTLTAPVAITESFRINTGSVANLSTFTNYTDVLYLGGVQQAAGSWGSTASPATNQNDTYFALTTGIVNVATGVTACNAPDVPTLSASNNPICQGEQTTISITSGNLNDATYWQWYSGSCGGTFVGTGTSIVVSPATTTTYYVRGEGECTGECGQITITVNELPVAVISGDQEICEGEETILTASGGVSYVWSTSETTNSITVNSAGIYSVTATDANGCTDTESVEVIVTELPTISCPADMTENSDIDECSRANVTYNVIITGDNPVVTYQFTGATLGSGIGTGSNSTFNVGVTTVTVYVEDTCGNTSCSFTITIEDNQPPTIITCPSNQNVNLNSQCKLIIPNLVPQTTANDNCSSYTVTQSPPAFSAHDSGHNQTHIVVMTVTDTNNNSTSCIVVLTAKDVTNPTITTCPSPADVNLNANCELIVTDLVTQTTATDNCTVTVTQSPTAGTALASSHNQVHMVTVTATDAAGNTATCTVALTGKDVTNPTITSCPSDADVNLNENCQLIVTDLVAQTSATDNCSVTVTQSPAAGTALASSHNQVHMITVTATDAAGNTATCTVALTGKDVTNPTITTCPSDADVDLNENCELIVTDLVAQTTATDNCAVTVTQSPTAGTALASSHNQVHMITVTATDAAGNTDECTVSLTGKDVTDPTIMECPEDREVDLNEDQELVVPNLTDELVADDNCGATVTQNPTEGTALSSSNNQTHDVTLIVTDDAGNSTQCIVTLTGKYESELSVICPEDISVESTCNCEATVVEYDDAEVTAELPYTVYYSHPSGSTFPVGATVVTVVVTDSSDNTAECTFTVTVEDNERMKVTGNNVEIENGSTTPSATNHTAFGTTALNGTITRTFTIRNEGCEVLVLTGNPIVTIGGADPSYFVVTAQPSTTEIEPCGSVTFSIRYTGSTYGVHNAIVSISNNSPGQNPYTFAISGATSDVIMQVRGNSVNIPNGDVTPITRDFTDFGIVGFNSNRNRTFYIHNLGTGSLILTGDPRVQLSGPGAHLFTVTLQPASPIAGGQSKGFIIRFDATEVGDFYATVSIESNDPGANPYTFTIRATVLAPNMYVTGNNITIENGDNTPQTADLTDFGTRAVGSTTTHSYYVRNHVGGGLLYLHGVPRAQISGSGAAMFMIATQPASTLQPGGSTLMRISFKPTAIGTYTATITIPNNDPNKDPYTFDVRGSTSGAMPYWGGNEDMPASITEEQLSVYPNPVIDVIFINAPYRQENYSLELMSIEGRVVHRMQTQGGRIEINIQSWLPGMYYIRAIGVDLDPVRFIRSK